MDNTLLHNIMNFFQSAMETLAYLTHWLWTPFAENEQLPDWLRNGWNFLGNLMGAQNLSPIMLFSATAIVVILVLHVVHLVNVIAG